MSSRITSTLDRPARPTSASNGSKLATTASTSLGSNAVSEGSSQKPASCGNRPRMLAFRGSAGIRRGHRPATLGDDDRRARLVRLVYQLEALRLKLSSGKSSVCWGCRRSHDQPSRMIRASDHCGPTRGPRTRDQPASSHPRSTGADGRVGGGERCGRAPGTGHDGGSARADGVRSDRRSPTGGRG